MEKTSRMTKVHHLKTDFVKRIRYLTKGYAQDRVIYRCTWQLMTI